jgi:hypothetical protein
MAYLDELFAKVKQDFDDANQSDTTGTYAKLAAVLTEAEAELREHAQRTTANAIQSIIRKLEKNDAIGPDDLQLIKLWIVGDAESYVAVENNFHDWKADVERIVSELGSVSTSSLDGPEAMRVRAKLRDAIRSAWDLHYYLEHKERVESFDESTRELDESGRKILARALERKLKSPAY